MLDRPIKAIGMHEVKIALHPEVAVTVKVNVARSPEEAELQAQGVDVMASDVRARRRPASPKSSIPTPSRVRSPRHRPKRRLPRRHRPKPRSEPAKNKPWLVHPNANEGRGLKDLRPIFFAMSVEHR